jgi:ATP-dependent helicase/nuclease subunit A
VSENNLNNTDGNVNNAVSPDSAEGVRFTPEQLDAINADGCSVIVSAAAGSGKTKVLVERLIRRICDENHPLSVTELTMVTFTKDAAAGMRQRLFDALAEKIRQNPRNFRLRREQALIPLARISTIDAFCVQLLREHTADLPIAAGFFVLDETRALTLEDKAVSAVFDRMYGSRPADMDYLTDIFNGEKRDSAKLRDVCVRIYKHIRSMPFYREYLPGVFKRYRSGVPEIFHESYLGFLRRELMNALSDAEYAVSAAENYGFDKLYDSIAAEFDEIRDIVERFNDSIDKKQPFEDIITIPAITFSALKRGSKPKPEDLTEDENAALEFILEMRDSYKAKLSQPKSSGRGKSIQAELFSADDIREDMQYNADLLEKLSELVNMIDDEYSLLKQNINGIDFADAEHFAVDILCDRADGIIKLSKTAVEIAAQNKTVMVDEYQDTNDVQDLIFKLIAHRDETGRPDNLYAVGDVKQSIYGFRAANPRIFLDTVKQAELGGNPALIRLAKNFRSSPEVVDFVNAVFTPLMTIKNFDGIDYKSDRLVCGTDYAYKNRLTEFVVAAGETSEAEAVAVRIRELLNSGAEVTEGAHTRPCEPRDFCILMRDRKRFSVFEKALQNAGIKAVKESTDTYLSSYEIQVLMNLLRILDNPKQDIPLVSVMMSPMFGFTPEDMAQIRLSDETGRAPIFTVIKSLSGEHKRIADMLGVITELKNLSMILSTDALIEAIYDRTDFLNAVGYRYTDGRRKKANLRLMIRYAKSYAANDLLAGVSGFIRYIERIIEKKGDFASAPNVGESENAVQIKTIHKSKGLEYPFVFLCDTAKNYNEHDLSEPFLFHPLYGSGVRFQSRETDNETPPKRYKTFPQFALIQIRRRELRAEAVRLLYVALTRAKERLFISFSDDDRKVVKPFSKAWQASGGKTDIAERAEECRNFLELLACALIAHPDGGIFRGTDDIPKNSSALTAIDGVQKPTKTPTLFNTIIIGESVSETAETPEVSDVPYYKPDRTVISKLQEIWQQQYPDSDTRKAAKLTVTEIALNSDIARVYSVKNISLRFDSAIADTPKPTASEKGTAMHRFLQKCDYNLAAADVRRESERLCMNGIMSRRECECLNYGRLAAFFASDFYREKIKNAGEIFRETKIYVKLSDIDLDENLKKEYNISDDSFLQGVADLVIKQPDGLILADYKTNGNFFKADEEHGLSSETLFTEHLKKLYTLQLRIYASALSAIFGSKVKEAYLYAFAANKGISINFT